MLDEKRVFEAKQNVRKYIDDGLLKREVFKDVVFDTYIRNSRESLALAESVFSVHKSYLWTIVISYYSMFYVANAVLYKMGYKVGTSIAHKVTADALIVFVRKKLSDAMIESYEDESVEALSISDNLIESFDFERHKRSRIQYETTEAIKESKAKTSLERARKFTEEMENLIGVL